jgi:hypothetical protein
LGNESETGLMVILVVAYAGAAPKLDNSAMVASAMVTNRAERKSTEAWSNRFSHPFMVFPSQVRLWLLQFSVALNPDLPGSA